MRNMLRIIIGTAVLAAFAGSALAQSFDHTEYMKGANGNRKGGKQVQGSLNFDAAQKRIEFHNKKSEPEFSIANQSIKSILYERTAHPRYVEGILIAWPLLLTKTKKHWLTVQYTDPAGTGQFVIVRMDKNNYRQILAAAESQTGKTIQRAEED
jgi:hypothetical protein